MASEQINDTKLVMKYNDKRGNFTFSNFIPDVENEDLYDIAQVLNSFQRDKVAKIVRVTTKIIA
jgi:hypothetical protein